MAEILDLLRNLDTRMADYLAAHGWVAYGVLALIVFCQTAILFGPALPGNPLLFAAGLVASVGIGPWATIAVLAPAAILGNLVHYAQGRWLAGRDLGCLERGRLANKRAQTEAFFERYGPAAVSLAFFVPFVRCVAPLLAGLGRMPALPFAAASFVGGALWVGALVWAGYALGQVPWVRDSFGYLALGLVVLAAIKVAWDASRRMRAVRA